MTAVFIIIISVIVNVIWNFVGSAHCGNYSNIFSTSSKYLKLNSEITTFSEISMFVASILCDLFSHLFWYCTVVILILLFKRVPDVELILILFKWKKYYINDWNILFLILNFSLFIFSNRAQHLTRFFANSGIICCGWILTEMKSK